MSEDDIFNYIVFFCIFRSFDFALTGFAQDDTIKKVMSAQRQA